MILSNKNITLRTMLESSRFYDLDRCCLIRRKTGQTSILGICLFGVEAMEKIGTFLIELCNEHPNPPGFFEKYHLTVDMNSPVALIFDWMDQTDCTWFELPLPSGKDHLLMLFRGEELFAKVSSLLLIGHDYQG